MPTPESQKAFALDVVRSLRERGYQALWAGGCVRDLLLGLTPSDYDVATDARPDDVMRVFARRTLPLGVEFGVVRVLGPQGSGLEVEVATFRGDGGYSDGRRPDAVLFSTPAVDAARRDFTINGMFLDPIENAVLDYVGGRDDLARGILRAIGDPSARFREDKLRLLRAARFGARFALTLDPTTRAAVRSLASESNQVAAERVAQELRRMLIHRTRADAVELMLELGLAHAILPPIVALKGLFQGNPMRPEGDLWSHTMLVMRLLPEPVGFPLAFAALLHDVGKPDTLAWHGGRVSFHHHEHIGARTAAGLCRALKLSNSERERIVWLVEHHQYLGAATSLRASTLKRMLATPGINDLLALDRAAALASVGAAPEVEYCEWYLRAQPSGPIDPPPLLTGHDLARLGLRPGPIFAKLLDEIREAQLDGTLQDKQQALDWAEAKKQMFEREH